MTDKNINSFYLFLPHQWNLPQPTCLHGDICKSNKKEIIVTCLLWIHIFGEFLGLSCHHFLSSSNQDFQHNSKITHSTTPTIKFLYYIPAELGYNVLRCLGWTHTLEPDNNNKTKQKTSYPLCQNSLCCSFSIPDPSFTGDVLGLTLEGNGNEAGLGTGSGPDG